MLRRHTDITYGLAGQTLRYRVPQARPTSATFKVFSEGAGDDGTVEFEGAATVDTVNTTVSASSGAQQSDPRRVNLASTAGIAVGRKYLLTESSLQEWVEVLSIHAGYVRVRDRLVGDFTTAATFQGCDITAAVDATWVADLANLSDLSDPNPDYRVRWAIVIGGVDHLAYSYFELVRSPRIVHVDIHDLTRRWPGLSEMLNTADRLEQARGLIEDAWRVVRVELKALDLNDTSVMDDETLDEATILAARLLLAEGGIHPRAFSATEYVQLAMDRFSRYVEQHLRVTLRPPIATGSDSGAEPREAASYWEK